MSVYSYSRITTFENCPFRYKLKYIDEIKSEICNIEAYVGTCVHSTLEKLYNDLCYNKLNSLQELIQFYQENWQNNWHSNIKIVRVGYSKEQYQKMGEKYIRDYYQKYEPFCDGKTIEMEKHVKTSLDLENKYFIQGYIDRLVLKNGVYEVHDYKTTNSLATYEKINNDWQLAVYQMALYKMYPDIKEIKLVWFYLAFDQRIEICKTYEEIENLKQIIINKIKVIEEETLYLPVKNSLCPWCDYEELCPKRKHFFIAKNLSNEEISKKGINLVERYVVLKQSKLELQERLKKIEEKTKNIEKEIISYMKENNMEIIKGQKYLLKVKFEERLKFPTKEEPKRKELEQLIKKLAKWEEVSILNIAMLLQKIKEKVWAKEIVENIEKFGTKAAEPLFFLSKINNKIGGRNV